ncbi:MAG TPA: choice-of-anchor D domain-containing protein [Candidatus Acidoferrum sp.]|nr:choice-of-anchor D domain-containing protein [Candidatus Acidoferrum sp.]
MAILSSCAGYTSTKVTQPSADLALALSTTSLSFGRVTVSSSSLAQGATVSNNSTGEITVNGITVSGPFTSASNKLPTTLNPGESLTFNLIFKPSASGVASGSLTINSTAENSPSVVNLNGTGVSTPAPGNLAISPSSLSFGTEPVGSSSAAQSILVSNNGAGSITISSVGVSGPFTVTGGTAPVTLNSGQTMTLKATFSPSAAGAASGNLTINSTDGNSPATVTLSGTGAACNAMVNPGDNLPQIVSANPEGTTFCFTAGTYRMTTNMLPKNNDVFLGLSLGVVLNGSQLVTFWTQSGNYWVAANQPQLIAQTSDVCADSTSTACQFPDAVFLDNKPLNRVMSVSDVVSGTFYRDYGNKQIYIADNPTGHTVEAIVCGLPFLANGAGADGVLIQGLTIEKFAGNNLGAVQGRATWTIQGNEVRLNHGDGIYASGNILGNYSHDNGDFGLEGGFASTAMNVQGNEFAFNNWANFANGGGAKFEYATNLVVRNNYAHDNFGPGFHTDGDSANVLYEYNHTKNNMNAGLQHEISWDAVIRYNLFEDETTAIPASGNGSLWDHSSIAILNSSNVQIYGNTFTGSTNGIAGILGIRGSSTHGPHTGQTYLLQNLDVHDNTFSAIATTAAGIVKIASFDNSVYTSWNNHFTSDSYSLSDSNRLYFTWLDSSGKNAYATYSWDQWQSFGNDVAGTFQVATADTTVAAISSRIP